MNMIDFLKTIYVGDRYVKGFIIDSQQKVVKIQVDSISRVRSEDGLWNFYNDENIDDGLIVFSDVEAISFDPPGFIPNDGINYWDIKKIKREDDQDVYDIELYIGSYYKLGEYNEVKVCIRATRAYLEDPLRPGIEICE